jgi:hypothetical protein
VRQGGEKSWVRLARQEGRVGLGEKFLVRRRREGERVALEREASMSG